MVASILSIASSVELRLQSRMMDRSFSSGFFQGLADISEMVSPRLSLSRRIIAKKSYHPSAFSGQTWQCLTLPALYGLP